MLSRVADSCFWLSRYVERAETNARLLDVNLQLLLDYENQEPGLERKHWKPVLATLEDQELFQKLNGTPDAESVIHFLTFEPKNPNSIRSSIASARENARTVREQISSEMWEQLNTLHLYLHGPEAKADFQESPYDFFHSVIEGAQLFQGITDTTMNHGEGWLFIQAAKYLERADATSRVLDIKYHILLPSGEQVGGGVDLTQWMAVLRSCSALEAYLKVHAGRIAAWQVAEFLILHSGFPRSIRFCADHLDRTLHRISGQNDTSFANEAERLSGMLRSNLDFATISSIFRTGLHEYLDNIQLRLTEVSDALAKTYCEWLDPAQQEQKQSTE